MPDWDEDSPELRRNLTRVLQVIVEQTAARQVPTVEFARGWQSLFMNGLRTNNPVYIGNFRGERGLEQTRVKVAAFYGVPPAKVAEALRRFESKLQAIISELDRLLPAGAEPDSDQLAAVVDVCAWAHAEWIRIHPFANGNGRTARLWANFIAMRYGLPPFVRLRPRPDEGYGTAGAKAMQGDWKPTAAVFRKLLDNFLAEFAG